MASETIAYNKKDLRDIYKAFKLMDDQATDEARRQSAALAYFASIEPLAINLATVILPLAPTVPLA